MSVETQNGKSFSLNVEIEDHEFSYLKNLGLDIEILKQVRHEKRSVTKGCSVIRGLNKGLKPLVSTSSE